MHDKNRVTEDCYLSCKIVCKKYLCLVPNHYVTQALTLDCGNHWPGGPVNHKIHWPPKKPTGPPPKTCNHPNVFAAGIYDFTREVANFCTLGIYITKNKYELTLPSEFCRLPVKNNGGIRSTKKNELARQPQKGMRISGHIANVKACNNHEYDTQAVRVS